MDIRTVRFLPEISNDYSELSELIPGNEIHVFPTRWISERRTLIVECQNESFDIPEEELSIYSMSQFQNVLVPKEIYKIFENRILSVKVCQAKNGKIYLSRRENMLDALKFFLSNYEEFFDALVIKSSLRAIALCEIGAGIIGAVHFSECSNSFVRDVSNYLIEKSDNFIIPVKIIYYSQEDNQRISLSYKQTLKPPKLNIGDCVIGRIARLLPDHSGVFVEIHPLASGIMDLDAIDFFRSEKEASKAKNHDNQFVILEYYYAFIVRGIGKNGFKLSLISLNY